MYEYGYGWIEAYPMSTSFDPLPMIYGVTLALLVFFLCTIGINIRQYRRLKKVEKNLKEAIETSGCLEQQKLQLNEITGQLVELKESVEIKVKENEDLSQSIAALQSEQAIAATKTAAAQREAQYAKDMADKELQLQMEKQRAEALARLEKELEELEIKHPKTTLAQELEKINAEIELARHSLRVQQEQARKAAQEEDMIEFHSISLTKGELEDIELIRKFSPQLTRQEAFFKLIWTEFYQKPIQALCKLVKAEKIRGVYKITNVKTKQCYIGQAVDIAARWKEHCKYGLGVGSTSYKTNKFYKALHNEGIENFTFEILEMGDIDLWARERYWIEFYGAVEYGYNSKVG